MKKTIVTILTSVGALFIIVTMASATDTVLGNLIYAVKKGGKVMITVADSIRPAKHNKYTIGTKTRKFKNGYFKKMNIEQLTTSSLIGNGIVSSENLTDNAITSEKIADGAIASGDILDGTITEDDISEESNITLDSLYATDGIYANSYSYFGYLSTTNDIYTSGDLNAHYESNGMVHTGFVFMPSTVSTARNFGDGFTAFKNGVGSYTFVFTNLNIYNNRYFQFMPWATTNMNCVGTPDPLITGDAIGKTLAVRCFNAAGAAADPDYLTVLIF